MFEEQRCKAKSRVNMHTALAAGLVLATSPIRGSSIVLTGIEAKMVYDVALIYGFHLEMDETNIIVENLFATSNALETLVTKIRKFVPILVWLLVKPSIAAATCKTIGEVAIRYFEDKLQLKLDEAKNKLSTTE